MSELEVNSDLSQNSTYDSNQTSSGSTLSQEQKPSTEAGITVGSDQAQPTIVQQEYPKDNAIQKPKSNLIINKKIILLTLIGAIILIMVLAILNPSFFGLVVPKNYDELDNNSFVLDDNKLVETSNNGSDSNILSQEEYLSQLPKETDFCEHESNIIDINKGVFAIPTNEPNKDASISPLIHRAKYFLIYTDGVFTEAWENFVMPNEKQVVEALKAKGIENIITLNKTAIEFNVETKKNDINCYWTIWGRETMPKLIARRAVKQTP